MKTNAKKQAVSSTVSKEVKQYETARKKFIAAWEKSEKIRNTPAVREFMKMKDPKQPSPEEQRKKELIHLYDEYSMNLKKAKDKLWILAELSFAKHDVDIPIEALYGTISEIDEHVQTVQEKAAKAFEMLGIGEPKEEEEKAA